MRVPVGSGKKSILFPGRANVVMGTHHEMWFLDEDKFCGIGVVGTIRLVHNEICFL